jgi:23S rRNA (uracil1939-C5)-methyltransferase
MCAFAQTDGRVSLKLADKISLTIHDLAFGGEGVGRVDDFVVFVPFVIVGETVEVEITEVKKNFARAKLLRIVTPSPERVTPECRYFTQCGGCQYQHIDYAAQLGFKHKQIADLFERFGKISREKSRRSSLAPRPTATATAS